VTTLSDHTLLLSEEGEKLRWFLLPSESAALLAQKPPSHLPKTPPFVPRAWDLPSKDASMDLLQLSNTGNRTQYNSSCTEISEELLDKTLRDLSLERDCLAFRTQLESSCAESTCNSDSNGPCLVKKNSNTEFNDVCSLLSESNASSVSKNTEIQTNLNQSGDPKESKENDTTNSNSGKDSSDCKQLLEPNDKTMAEEKTLDSSRMDCRTLGQACPLNRQNTSNVTKNTKQNKNDVNYEKTVATKPKFFHPPKSIFKPMVEVGVAITE